MSKIFVDVEMIKLRTRQAVSDQIADPITVRLGHPAPTTITGDGINVPVSISGTPGYVYFRALSDADADADLQGQSMALNNGKLRREDAVYGQFIQIKKRRRGGFIVIGLDEEASAEYAYKMIVHPQTSTVLSQFDNLMLQPTQPPTMKAGIGYGIIRYMGQVYKRGSIFTKDFTADIPAVANQSIAVCVEYSPADELIFYTNGSAFATSLTDQDAFDAGYFPAPSKALMCGWIRLANGMTTIRHITNIATAHEVMSINRMPQNLVHKIIFGDNHQFFAKEITLEDAGEVAFEGTAELSLF